MNASKVLLFALIYWVIAIPLSIWVARRSKRAWVGGLFSGCLATLLVVLFNSYLPFDFWNYVNKFILDVLSGRAGRSIIIQAIAIQLVVPILVATIVGKYFPKLRED